jgi:hypothetical protein
MNQKDQLKVINSGFTIIRKEEAAMKIKFKNKDNHDWKTLSNRFASKAALQRRVDELLKISTVIED